LLEKIIFLAQDLLCRFGRRFGMRFAEAAILAGRAGQLPFWQFIWLADCHYCQPIGSAVTVILLRSYINFATVTIIIYSNKPVSAATILGPQSIYNTIQLDSMSTNITTDANPFTILHLLAKPMVIVNGDSSLKSYHFYYLSPFASQGYNNHRM
jgi:hypothetical protein